MNGTGCWRNTLFVERLWRSVKYEEVYLRAYDSISAARQGVERYLTSHNQMRPHRALDVKTPEEVYCDNLTIRLTAACQTTGRRHSKTGTCCPTSWGHLSREGRI